MKCHVILCHKNNSLISKGIRFITGSYWNHSAILVNNFIYEAVFPRIRKIRYSEWVDINENVERKAIEFELINDPNEMVGKSYDLGIFINEVLFYLFARINGKTSKSAKFFSNRNNDSKWFCFEFSAYCVGKKKYWSANGLTFDKKSYICKT